MVVNNLMRKKQGSIHIKDEETQVSSCGVFEDTGLSITHSYMFYNYIQYDTLELHSAVHTVGIPEAFFLPKTLFIHTVVMSETRLMLH